MNSGATASVGIAMTTYERLVQPLEKALVASDEAFDAANAAMKDAKDAGGNEDALRRFGEYVSQRAAERSGR